MSRAMPSALARLKKPGDLGAIDLRLFQRCAQILIQYELRRGGKSFGKGNREIGEKTHERRARLVNLPIERRRFGEIGSQDFRQDASLLVVKERAQRVVRFAEATLHHA